MDAYKMFQDGWLKEILHMKVKGYNLIRAKVYHSMRIPETPLEPWTIVTPDGTVKFAHCTRVAGLGEGCSHIGAVLFAMETATRIRKEASVTDVPAYWLFPETTTFTTPFKQIKDIEFSSASKRRRRLEDEISGVGIQEPTSTEPRCEISSPTKGEINDFMEKLHKALPRSAALSLNDRFCKEFQPKYLTLQTPINLETLFDVDSSFTVYEDVVKHCRAIDIGFSQEQAKTVEKETRRQSKCKLWQTMRTGRITASVFYDACHSPPDNPSVCLIKRICCPRENQVFSRATEYGEKRKRIPGKTMWLWLKSSIITFLVWTAAWC